MVFGITIGVTDTVSTLFSNLNSTLHCIFNICEFPCQLTFCDALLKAFMTTLYNWQEKR